MMEEMIKIRSLNKSFGNHNVLVDIDLTLHRGENIVILGRSGIGKSVLAKCIVGLLHYDSGSIEVFGKEVSKMKKMELDEIRLKIGYLFQGGALYDSLTVRENLEFPILRSRFFKMTRKEINNRVDEALDNVGLKDTHNKMPAELSGGMKKRIGLARTLILKPEIIIYDEPTTGLDPVTSNEISLLMLKIQEMYKTSSIIITHDLKCAKLTANTIKLMKDGNFYAEGSYSDLKKSKDTEVINYFK